MQSSEYVNFTWMAPDSLSQLEHTDRSGSQAVTLPDMKGEEGPRRIKETQSSQQYVRPAVALVDLR